MSKAYMEETSRERVLTKFNDIVVDMYNKSKSGTDFKGKLEERAAESRIDRNKDGVDLTDNTDSTSFQDKRKAYADLYLRYANSNNDDEANQLLSQITKMEEDYPELQNDKAVDDILAKLSPQQADKAEIKHTAKSIEENKAQADKTYYKTSEDKKPASSNMIEQSFGSGYIDLNNLSEAIKKMTDVLTGKKEDSSLYFEACKKEASKEWVDTDKVAYRKNTYESNGKTVEYTQAAQKVDWGRLISDNAKSTVYNLEQLRTFISRQIYDYYGGFSRIKSIVVRSQQLIINDICYMPLIDRKYLNDASLFPLDTLDYIKNGYIAPLFNWRYLKKMSRLTLLDIDDTNFYISDIASDIGAGRRAGLTTIFNIVPSLEVFILGGDVVKEDEIDTEKGRKVKEKIAKFKHFTNFSDGYKLNVYGGTNGLQNWTVGNLKTYATSRGNKGFIRFSAGLIGRGIMAGIAGTLNLGVHLIGGAFHVGSHIFMDAITDVEPEDLE